MNKLAPNIKLGCPKCGKIFDFDTKDFDFKITPTNKENKVTSIIKSSRSKKSSKVISLF